LSWSCTNAAACPCSLAGRVPRRLLGRGRRRIGSPTRAQGEPHRHGHRRLGSRGP
jgi:hypothetical protein